MEALHRDLAPKGLVLAAVNIGERPEEVRRWVETRRLTFTVLLDRDQAATIAYRVVGTPTVFLLDRQGRVVAHAVGPRGWTTAKARALLEGLLAAPAS